MVSFITRPQMLLPICRSVMVRSASAHSSVIQQEHDNIKPFKDIPGPKGVYKWPIIGPLLLFRFSTEKIEIVLNKLFDQYGPIVKVQFLSPHVILADPKDFETVFRNEGKSPMRPPFTIVQAFSKRQGLKEPMVNLQGEEWYNLRTAANKHLLKVNSATHYLPQHNQVADDFVKILTSKKCLTDDLLLRYAAESVGVVTFNKRLGFLEETLSEETLDIFKATRNVGELLAFAESGKSVTHTFYRNKTYRDFESSYLKIRRSADAQISKAKEEIERREREGTIDSNEPNLLLSLTSEKSVNNDDVNNILSSLYIGGSDSMNVLKKSLVPQCFAFQLILESMKQTSKTILLLFYTLATNPEKQEILRKEIISLIGNDGPLTASALSQMTYLKACIKESFRLKYPMISGRNRTLPTDCVLGGYMVPAGTNILMINTRAVKSEWKDQHDFTPERWLRSSQDRKSDAASNLIVAPFGHGPRSCLGQRLAMQEMYMAVVKVLQKLKVDLEPDSINAEFIYKFFLEPVKPLHFKLTEIN